jgi:hypothetical protein
MRLTRRRILRSLGWGPRQALGVPLPLVVAPQGMPRQPCLCVLIMRDAQLHAEPPVWLSRIVLGRGQWRTYVASSFFLQAPLLRDGLFVVPDAGGLCPLAWREGVGYHLSHVRLRGLWPPTTFMLTAAGLWQQSALQHRGVVTRCWCNGGGGYPPSLGGGFMVNQRLLVTAPTSVLGSGRGTF